MSFSDISTFDALFELWKSSLSNGVRKQKGKTQILSSMAWKLDSRLVIKGRKVCDFRPKAPAEGQV